MVIWVGLLMSLFSLKALAYVYEGSQNPKLGVSPQQAEATFYLDPDPPNVINSWRFREGSYIAATNRDLWMEMVKDAFNLWNSVEGSYLRLILSEEPLGNRDPNDKLNVILFSSALPANSGAQSFPIIKTRSRTIDDCDIMLHSKPDSVENILYYLVHEVGHCVGIGHDHLDPYSIMSYARRIKELKLSVSDQAALVGLYPDPNLQTGKTQEFAPCGWIPGPKNPSQNRVGWWILGAPLFLLMGLRFRRQPKKKPL
jgi:hypothetical protein